VALALATRPDVAVLALTLPELNGVETTRQARRELPGTGVRIFTVHQGEQLVREALLAGAPGYVLKDDAAEQLVPAVEAVAGGRPFFSTPVSAALLDAFAQQTPGPVAAGDSWSEHQRSAAHVQHWQYGPQFAPSSSTAYAPSPPPGAGRSGARRPRWRPPPPRSARPPAARGGAAGPRPCRSVAATTRS
jgi:CheY-like chemotaxis protein